MASSVPPASASGAPPEASARTKSPKRAASACRMRAGRIRFAETGSGLRAARDRGVLHGRLLIEELGKLLRHGAAKLLRIHDSHGTPVIARHVVAYADGDQFDRRARFDLLDHPTQMAFEVIAGIDRKSGIINRRSVRYHHQDPALLSACQQALMGPVERFAVDVLLEQTFAHHQAEILARAPPG